MNRHIDPSRYTVTDDTEIVTDIDLDAEPTTAATGERYTEAEAEAYTEQRAAEARKGGRPSLGNRGASPQVAFRIPAELRAAAEAVAAQEGRTISAIAREQLERYVNSHAA